MIKVRSEGLKVDLVLANDKVTGLLIDFQNVNASGELKKWINVVDDMIFTPVSALASPMPTTALVVETPAPLALPMQVSLKEEVEETNDEPPEVLPEEPLGEPIVEPLEEMVKVEVKAEPEPLLQQTEGPKDVGNYRTIVRGAVDKSLDILGKEGKQVLLSLLENRYGVHEEEIPDHARGFIEILEEALGSSAYTVEREIMSEIRKITQIQGVNLHSVVELLMEEYPADTPAVQSFASTVAVEEVTSQEVLAPREDEEKPAEAEAKQETRPLEDPIPAGFSYTMKDPIPIGYKYHASFSKEEV